MDEDLPSCQFLFLSIRYDLLLRGHLRFGADLWSSMPGLCHQLPWSEVPVERASECCESVRSQSYSGGVKRAFEQRSCHSSTSRRILCFLLKFLFFNVLRCCFAGAARTGLTTRSSGVAEAAATMVYGVPLPSRRRTRAMVLSGGRAGSVSITT